MYNYQQLQSVKQQYSKTHSNDNKNQSLPSYYNFINNQDTTLTTTATATMNRGLSQTIVHRSNQLTNEPIAQYSYNQSLKDQILSPGDNIKEFNSKPLYSPSPNVNPYYYNNSNGSTNSSYDKPISSQAKKTPCSYLPQHTKNNKKTLVLDLDETLVHSAFKPFFFKADLVLNVHVDNANHNVFVLKRPHCSEFLERMAQYYEIVVFTASISQYANPLLDQLDQKRLISHRLFREHCVYSNGLYVKDLKRLGRNMKDTLIVDNNPISYAVNKDNGVPILTWHYDKTDTELIKLIPFLEVLAGVDDVRSYIRNAVLNNSVNFDYVNQLLSKSTPSFANNNLSDKHQFEHQSQYQNARENQQQLEYYRELNQNQNKNQNCKDDKPYETKCTKCNCGKDKSSHDYPSSSMSLKGRVTPSSTPLINHSNQLYNRIESNIPQSINDSYVDKPQSTTNNTTLKLMSYTPNTDYRRSNNEANNSYGSYTGYFNERYRVNSNSNNNNNSANDSINEYYRSKIKERDRQLDDNPYSHINNTKSDNLNHSMVIGNSKYSQHLFQDQHHLNNYHFDTIQKEDTALQNQSNQLKYEDKYLHQREERASNTIMKENRHQTISRSEFPHHTSTQTWSPFHNYSQGITTKMTNDEYTNNNTQSRAQFSPSHSNKDIALLNSNNYSLYQNNHMRNDNNANNVTINKAMSPPYSIHNYIRPSNNTNYTATKINNSYYKRQSKDIVSNNSNRYPQSLLFEQEPFNKDRNDNYLQQPNYYRNNQYHEITDCKESNLLTHNILRTPQRDYDKLPKGDLAIQQQQQQQPQLQLQYQPEREIIGSKSVDRMKRYDSPIYQYYRGNTKNNQQTQPMYLQERENNLSFTRVNNEYTQPKQTLPQYQAQNREYIPYKRVFGHLQKK